MLVVISFGQRFDSAHVHSFLHHNAGGGSVAVMVAPALHVEPYQYVILGVKGFDSE